MSKYETLLRQIQDRYNPENNSSVYQRVFSNISGIDRDIAKYVKMAMNEVDDVYTSKTMEAGAKVMEHLSQHQSGIEYRYQGSVMTNTHIKGVSDIDLLTITDKFDKTDYFKIEKILQDPYSQYTYGDLERLKTWKANFSQYRGNTQEDLRQLRISDESILCQYYSNCDTSKAKSIKVKNLHLNRDVDVVVAAWHDSVNFVRGLGDEFRGIHIYDKINNLIIGPDYPFLSIARINTRSKETCGRLKKMIRFLKNVRTDAEDEIKLTSFEINAICYDIPVEKYRDSYYLDLVYLIWHKLYILLNNANEAERLMSVDGSEAVFRNKPDKLAELKKLESEVWNIYNELK